ncbi:carbohydrate ABC transporter permease [Candidatus Hecatella orcuttiae]|jgi:multiple sugar transport system permease protein|uniref:carbohydrate ABC transporter permease n=1 Tax=Candidatus Hecatella orcuttiae TaxID=1935119 RepID=UPI002867F1E1|nr:carbohydrate ABC transporter permease [Candidatus Hecatella orcuttiae]
MAKGNRALLYFAVIIIVLWSFMPIYWILNLSLQFESTIYATPTNLAPLKPTDYWYRRILQLPVEEIEMAGASVGAMTAEHIGRGLKNSILVALPVSVIATAVGSLSGYAFGRLKFKFKNGWLVMLLASQVLPPVAVVLPFFIFFLTLGLLGTLHGLMIIYLGMLIPLVTWVLLGFFAGLPLEIERAARIDGCGRLEALRKIVLPMAAPGIVAGWVLAFITAYNEFMYAWILTTGSFAQTLPPAITGLFFQDTGVPEMSAAVMLSLLPVLALGLVLQKYIMQLRIVDPVTVVA